MIPPRKFQLDEVAALSVSLRMRPPSVPVRLWRWRWETFGLVTVIGGFYLSARALGVLQTGLLILAAAALAFAFRPVREWLINRYWCVLTPHRFRHGCEQSGLLNFRGRIPAVLWTTPMPFGERMYVWCPAGITVDSLIAAHNTLAAACWARDVQTSTTSSRWSQLATVDVIRNSRPATPADLEPTYDDPFPPSTATGPLYGGGSHATDRADRHADWHRAEEEPGLRP
jgi:hypothetical protein